MPKAYIGIGSNLGNREKHCECAIALLIINSITVTKRSSMIETDPWGIEDQPGFINMTVEIETKKKPLALLSFLKKIEGEIGRKETFRWGPRVIDLDILFYDDVVMKTQELEVPHPGILEREFVLRSLSEIAPDLIHPVFKKSISDMLEELAG